MLFGETWINLKDIMSSKIIYLMYIQNLKSWTHKQRVEWWLWETGVGESGGTWSKIQVPVKRSMFLRDVASMVDRLVVMYILELLKA